MKPYAILACILLAFATPVLSQDKSTAKFGKITAADFAPKAYAIDSNASAVVIADIGSTEISGNSKGSFSLIFKHYRRAHILNKNGYDIGDVSVSIYTDGDLEEELSGLKAVTYNLENGKVVETKLDTKSAVFKDRINKNRVVKKFTFPNLKEGSIIEYEYVLKSDFIVNLQPWDFQGRYPRLWSEYVVSLPEFYYYVTLTQGYQPYFIKDQKSKTVYFNVSDTRGASASERSSFNAGVTDFRWVMKDVPPLKEENFTSTLDNHIARIEFQLSELRYPFTPKNIMGSWAQVCEDLLKDPDFGYALDRDNGWMDDELKPMVKGTDTDMEKARSIFAYVRDHMTCTNHSRRYLEHPLKNVLKNKNGNEAEINLLLTAMLRKAGIAADPVMLSTRSNGYVYALYPLIGRFNYVITRARIDGHDIYLDASQPHMGFGKLDADCYNGHARVINAEATAIAFQADSLFEQKVTSVFIINDDKGNFSGSVQQSPGYYESAGIRDRIKDKGKEQFVSEIKKSFTGDVDITDTEIDSLDQYDNPVTIRYKFNLKTDNEDIIYFTPMLGEAYKENPFKSAERFYPVEMPYTIDRTYLLQLAIPDGYVTDELPKQIMVKLNEENDGFFEYRISESNGTISMRSRLKLKRSFYAPEEYEMLREFFNMVVKKQSEQVVFKKKK